MIFFCFASIWLDPLPYFKLADPEAAYPAEDTANIEGYELSPEARALADLKFTYVVTCQIYGKQKEERQPQAADILLLMQRLNCTLSRSCQFFHE